MHSFLDAFPERTADLNYSDTDCQDLCMDPEGCDMIVEFPGYGNLSEYGYPPWTDRIGSFTCELSN